jgi:hypothetical protein
MSEYGLAEGQLNYAQIATPNYSLYVAPNPVGYWLVGGHLRLYVLKKCTDEQIKNTEELLGWIWKDV